MSEKIVLALETSRRSATLALWRNGKICTKSMELETSQSSLLLPLVNVFLAEVAIQPEQITDMVIHVGPGGSTGLRMGVAMAQAWSLVYPQLRTHAVPLEAVALTVLKTLQVETKEGLLLADAFAGQLFRAHYKCEQGAWRKVGELELCRRQDMEHRETECYVLEDLGKLKGKCEWPKAWQWHEAEFPVADQVLRSALKDEYILPIAEMDVRYLKPSSAEISWDQRQVLGV